MTDERDVPPSPLDANLLERYVLGLLAEAEREAVETRAFTDPAVAVAIDVAETDLVDAHVAGALTGERGEAFAGALAARPRLRGRVAASRVLAARRESSTVPRWWWPMLAAASVLVVAGVWMLRQTAAPPGLVPASASQQARPAPPAVTHPSTGPEHTVARDESPQAPVPPPVPPTPAEPQPARVTFAVLLPMGGTRASAVTEAVVPPSASRIAFEVPVMPGDDYAHFRLRLLDGAGRLVGEMTASRLPSDRTLRLVVDRAALADGTYDVELEGRQEGGPFEPLAFLQVRLALAPAVR